MQRDWKSRERLLRTQRVRNPELFTRPQPEDWHNRTKTDRELLDAVLAEARWAIRAIKENTPGMDEGRSFYGPFGTTNAYDITTEALETLEQIAAICDDTTGH